MIFLHIKILDCLNLLFLGTQIMYLCNLNLITTTTTDFNIILKAIFFYVILRDDSRDLYNLRVFFKINLNILNFNNLIFNHFHNIARSIPIIPCSTNNTHSISNIPRPIYRTKLVIICHLPQSKKLEEFQYRSK